MDKNINLILGVVVLMLIMVSAFFSLVETALATCSKAKIHRMIKDGSKKAIKAESLLKDSESGMSTILLCNNTVNIIASTVTTGVLIKIFGESGMLYATIIMTVLVIVLGEIAPKTYALKNAEKITLFASPLILFLIKVLCPITGNIQSGIDKIFAIFSSKKHRDGLKNTTADIEEIKGTIDLKHRAGSIVKYDKDMLDSILDLGGTEIINIMVHRKNIISIDIDQDLGEILKKAFEINHSKIPLWRESEDNIVAILNIRKLVNIFHDNQGDISRINLKQFTSQPWFVPATNTIKSQLLAFRNKKEKFAIVIDEYGALMGVVTMEDILEEIVGDLDEEDRPNRLGIKRFKDGSYKISGELAVRDVNRKLNWDMREDENASTLAGLLISKIERIPEEKEEFEFDGFFFKILEVKDNKIVLINAKKNTN